MKSVYTLLALWRFAVVALLASMVGFQTGRIVTLNRASKPKVVKYQRRIVPTDGVPVPRSRGVRILP
jgi:hypothetical protein